jgi:uncharacterized OB-fold protein
MNKPAEIPALAEARTIPALAGVVRCEGDGWSQRLFGLRCRECGTVSLTRSRFCPACWNRDSQDEHTLSDRGTLYSYTIVHHAPPGYDAPYGIAYVDLLEGVRLMARVDAGLLKRLAPGNMVLIGVDPVGKEEDGTVIVGPVIREKIAAGGGK